MKEKLFDLIVKIESANPNDFEFGNAVRTVLLIADKGKEDIEIDQIIEKIKNNKNIKTIKDKIVNGAKILPKMLIKFFFSFAKKAASPKNINTKSFLNCL